MNTTLQIRIDKKTKLGAQKIFNELGVDMSSGVKIFLQQVINTESIPFDIRTPNGFTLAEEAKIHKEEQAAKKGKRYTSPQEMMNDILK